MATISTSDVIFATIIRGGRALLSTQLSGIDSLSSLVSYLKHVMLVNNMAPCTNSLMTLSVRNHTQGWTASRHLILA